MCLLPCLAKELLLSKHYFAKLLDLLARIALIDPDVRYANVTWPNRNVCVPQQRRTNIFHAIKAIDYHNDNFYLKNFRGDAVRTVWCLYSRRSMRDGLGRRHENFS